MLVEDSFIFVALICVRCIQIEPSNNDLMIRLFSEMGLTSLEIQTVDEFRRCRNG